MPLCPDILRVKRTVSVQEIHKTSQLSTFCSTPFVYHIKTGMYITGMLSLVTKSITELLSTSKYFKEFQVGEYFLNL